MIANKKGCTNIMLTKNPSNLVKILAIILLINLVPQISFALQTSRPLPSDSRLRVITYNPDNIHKYTGFYEYQASIIFGEGETIETISMGDPRGWQMVPAGNRLFIKPIADNPDDANTNMLLVTNKRTYHFILEASEVGEKGINDPNLVWETKFVYPDEEDKSLVQLNTAAALPDLTEPGKYNFNYTISGSKKISPKMIFDNGEFTYFLFANKNADIPAFFLVDSEGREAIINYRVLGDYIVIERVTSQFTLRDGSDTACVFNEKTPLEKKKKK